MLKETSLENYIGEIANLYVDDDLEVDEKDELEEFSSVGGGSISGYTGPLGDEKRKNIGAKEYLQKEQVEWMKRLESYHQRTTNKIK